MTFCALWSRITGVTAFQAALKERVTLERKEQPALYLGIELHWRPAGVLTTGTHMIEELAGLHGVTYGASAPQLAAPRPQNEKMYSTVAKVSARPGCIKWPVRTGTCCVPSPSRQPALYGENVAARHLVRKRPRAPQRETGKQSFIS